MLLTVKIILLPCLHYEKYMSIVCGEKYIFVCLHCEKYILFVCIVKNTFCLFVLWKNTFVFVCIVKSTFLLRSEWRHILLKGRGKYFSLVTVIHRRELATWRYQMGVGLSWCEDIKIQISKHENIKVQISKHENIKIYIYPPIKRPKSKYDIFQVFEQVVLTYFNISEWDALFNFYVKLFSPKLTLLAATAALK